MTFLIKLKRNRVTNGSTIIIIVKELDERSFLFFICVPSLMTYSKFLFPVVLIISRMKSNE